MSHASYRAALPYMKLNAPPHADALTGGKVEGVSAIARIDGPYTTRYQL